ncbi:MAG TPA: nucleoside-diphosphate kinase [Dehalococcoidia bacterium]|nr:nucleoside-diphosphate kinase [Dehalococcoidia bacterium]
MERTLVIIKPDAVQRGLMGRVVSRLEDRGLRILAVRMIRMAQNMAQSLYAMHEGKRFYPGLIRYMTSSPVVLMVVEGRRAVEVVRKTMGSTDPLEAASGSIRGDWGLEIGRNLIHGSDSQESAAREIGIFFDEQDLLAYDRELERWIFE